MSVDNVPLKRHGAAFETWIESAAGARFFCDDGLEWTEGRTKRPCMNHEEAQRRTRNDMHALKRDGRPEALRLSAVLNDCSSESPCMSAACTFCRRALQRAFVAATEDVKDLFRDWVAVNLILPRTAIRPGTLIGRDPFGPTATGMVEILRHARLRAIGGIDLSFNEHQTGLFEARYQPHGCVLIPGHTREEVKARLTPFLARTLAVKRPICALEFDGQRAGIAYLLKATFELRRSLLRERGPDGKLIGPSTRKDDIRVAERLEIAIAAHRFKLADRIILQGFQTVEHRGELRIEPVKRII